MPATKARLCLYLLALAPAGVCLIVWQGASWPVEHLNCVVRGKELSGCIFLGVDFTSTLGIGQFWGGLLMLPAALVSLVMLAAVPRAREKSVNVKNRRNADL